MASNAISSPLRFVAHPCGLVLFLVGFSGDGINAAKPTMKVDIGAALRAERAIFLGLRVDAANDT